MAKTGVTYEQVAFACQSLLKEGHDITARAILAKTGGSPNNVVKLWQRWRQEKEDIALAAVDEELSSQVKQAILAECARKTSLVKNQWADKVAATEKQLAEMGEMLLQIDLEKDRLTLELNKAQQTIVEQDKRQAVSDQRFLDMQSRCHELENLYHEAALGRERANTEKVMIEKQNQTIEKQIVYLENQWQEKLSSRLASLVPGESKKYAKKNKKATV
jgi:Plasmid replication region DNA-binding N-term